MKRVAVLGSTGSIGTQALQAIALHKDEFSVVLLSAGSNALLLERQVLAHRPEVAVLCNPPPGYIPPEVAGVSWLLGVPAEVGLTKCDIVLNALVGIPGLSASLAAAAMGVRLCLANKESMVAGGILVKMSISQSGAALLPVDSEHSAIFQCLQDKENAPTRLYLTASGGPFRTFTKEQMRVATPAQALQHPNWSMGQRISIDSATMMNKALEIVEAGMLFDMLPHQIEVLVQSTSIVHSMVEFADGVVIAQMGLPDMRNPILYALGYPKRLDAKVPRMDFVSGSPLVFEKPDVERFPALTLGYDVLSQGGTAGAVLNAADETAVACYLAGQCDFPSITMAVSDALSAIEQCSDPDLATIMEADRLARAYVTQWMGRRG